MQRSWNYQAWSLNRNGTSNRDRARPILARFMANKDKVRVLERGKNVKGTNVHMNEDDTEEVRQRTHTSYEGST